MKSTRYLLSLATVMLLVGLMLVPAVPTLADVDTTDITGNVTESISITAPPAFSLVDMSIGDYPDNQATSENGTVECNTDNWSVVVEDSVWATYEGCMHVGAYTLANAIQVQKKDTTYEVMDADGVIRLPDELAGSQDFTLTVRQKIVYTDYATTGYSITLKLTANY